VILSRVCALFKWNEYHTGRVCLSVKISIESATGVPMRLNQMHIFSCFCADIKDFEYF
jgi:hypothetical protein